jgi:hypothetical protein
MKRQLLLLVAVIPLVVFSQEDKKFGISFSGYVKNDIFFDSRQNRSLREGHFLLYPFGEYLDINGKDVNAKASFNMLSIQSRLTGNITGPDAFGAKSSAVIEGEFFGMSDENINTFRLRYSYVKLNWQTTELLVGQYWHPMFISDCFPDVVSFNTGAPFQPFSRNPQVRISKIFGDIRFMAAAVSQRDFTGPEGSTSLRNSIIPDMQLQLQYRLTNGSAEILAGAGAGYKMIQPRLITDSLCQTDEKVKGISYIAFLKYKTPEITVKCEGVLGQNLYNLTMLGGYAEKYTDDTARLNHDNYEYTTIDCYSVWADISSNGEKMQAGLFAAYSENLGSDDYFIGDDNIIGVDIKYLYRISPRIIFNSGKARFAFELEYTTAAYGRADIQGLVSNTKEVANLRALFAVYYFF